jgi:hypothetical protein
MARSVELSNGVPTWCAGGHIVVTARGFGENATTLTIYATGTPGQPGTIEIGTASNEHDFAQAEIVWNPGQQVLTDDPITIRVVGPEGNSAEASWVPSLYSNFAWGPCPS